MSKELLKDCKELLKMDLERATTKQEKLEVIARHNKVGKLLFGKEWKEFKLEEAEEEE